MVAAFVIQYVETPSGINMQREAWLEPHLHLKKKKVFLSLGQISVCALRTNILVWKGKIILIHWPDTRDFHHIL